ncbi:TDT family transporter, partial (plasmid) [Clostridium perfringens]
NPVTGTFYPTMGMVLWLVSGFFYPYFPVVCSWLWIAAVIYHYGIVIFYTIIRIKERKFENIMPTCFIVYTGMITGSVASKGMDGVIPQIPQIAHFMLMFGFIFYTILLPLVLYIVFKSEILDDHKLPTVGIICSPAPLGVVGILTIEPNPNPYMLAWLIITGLILLVVVYGYI